MITAIKATNWTVMVYLCADNSLASQARDDLEEMEAVGSGPDFHLVVQLDLPDQEAERLYIKKGGSEHYPIGEVDMCDIDVLYDFIRWAKAYYPSDHYCLILWDHGTGWTGPPQFGFGSDFSSGNTISFAEGEMELLLKRVRKLLGRKIDLLVFDACLMGMVEIAGEVANSCRYLVASELTVPASGLPYDQILIGLQLDPSLSPEGLARLIIDEYFLAYHDSLQVDLSLWDLDHYDEFRKALDKILIEAMTTPPDTFLPKKVRRPFPAHSDLASLLNNLDPGFEPPPLISYHKGSYSGGAIWLPDSYYDFRQGIMSYQGLNWTISWWEEFLNFTYDQDDIPPETPIWKDSPTKDNNLLLSWSRASDLAPVHYFIYKATRTQVVFEDDGSGAGWEMAGFEVTPDGYHSGAGNNLNNWMVMRQPVSVQGCIIQFDLSYKIQDLRDTLILEYEDGGWHRLCYYYGESEWERHRRLLPFSGPLRIRFRYRTDASTAGSGAYLKNITIYDLGGVTPITHPLTDTSFYLFNQPHGDHYYLVEAIDDYQNRSDIDEPLKVNFKSYATPYTIPNPFRDRCRIIFDSPSPEVSVYIFSLDGRLIRKLQGEFDEYSIDWDGRDEQGRRLKNGIYLVLVKTGSFSRLGKIAKLE